MTLPPLIREYHARFVEPKLKTEAAGFPVRFTEFCKVLGVDLTPGQRALTLVAFDGLDPCELKGEERDLARRLFGDVEVVPRTARGVLVAVCGARGGKTYVLCGLRSLHLALTVPLTTLAPGEAAVASIVAPGKRLAQQTLGYIRGAARECPAIARLIERDATESLTLRRPDGALVALECFAASVKGAALRGRSLVSAVLDEAAMFRDAESGQVNDEEVYRAVAPRVVVGGQVIVASTPWAKAGLLHALWKANHGHPSTALVAHAPTLVLRDDEHTRDYVAREEQRDPANARREFGAEFMSGDATAFFDARAIEAAVDESSVAAPTPEWAIVACGADFGFRTDSSALAVATNDAKKIRIVEVLERQPEPDAPLQPSVVVREFAAHVRDRGGRGVVADGHYREAIREHLSAEGLLFIDAPEGLTGKVETYTRVRALLHEGLLVLPNNERLLRQLREVKSRPTPGGGLSIEAPRWRAGGHGDLVSALVLAAYTAAQYPPKVPVEGPEPGSPEWLNKQIDDAKAARAREIAERQRKQARRMGYR